VRLLREATAVGFKKTRPVVTEAEANDNQWPLQRHLDGTLSVDMCLHCQIARSDQQKHPR
jgi:hypothetical protein